MKSTLPATILSALALAFSMIAIAMQLPPVSGYVASLRSLSPSGAEADVPSANRVGELESGTEPVPAADGQAKDVVGKALNDQGERIAMLERELSQIERVIRTSGLDAAAPYLAPPPGSAAPALAGIGERYATRARFEERRAKLLEHTKQMRQHDMDTYGQEAYRTITDLYDKARPTREELSPEEKSEREAALKSLLAEYPEAWSTSVAVAEQALAAAINRDGQGAEGYYQSLVEVSPYSEVVTEQGIDAIPALQAYLARQYVEEGRYDEASAMLDAISTRSGSVILEPNEMGEPTAKTVQDFVSEMRQKISH